MQITLERMQFCLCCLAAVVMLSCDDGSQPTVTTTYPQHHGAAAWSSQGQIVYRDQGVVLVNQDGTYQVDPALAGIWSIDPASGVKQRVSPFGHSPSWSPDGEEIVFVASGQIFKIHEDGSALDQLTSSFQNGFPSWSPDDQWIAYDSIQDHPDDGYAIWLMRTDGSGNRKISQIGVECRMPRWHPDGITILYSRHDTYGSDLYTIRIDSSVEVRLTTTPAIDHPGSFSPDGAKIVFSAQSPGSRPQVLVANADGSNVFQLTMHGGIEPAWSPDGAEVVYTRHNATENSPENMVLWIHDLATGSERQLTHKWNSLQD